MWGARSEITYLWIKDPQKWSWINADQELSEYQYQEALTGNYLPIILMKAVWSISFSAITAMFTAADPASMQHW